MSKFLIFWIKMLLTGESKEHWGRESKGKKTDRWQTESQVGPCSFRRSRWVSAPWTGGHNSYWIGHCRSAGRLQGPQGRTYMYCTYFDVLSKPNKKNNNIAELCKIGSMRRHHCLLDLDALPPMLSFEDIVVVHLGQRKGQELATVGTDSAYRQAVRWLSTYSNRYLEELKQCLTDLYPEIIWS